MRLINFIIIMVILTLLTAGGYVAYTQHQLTLVASNTRFSENLTRGFATGVWKLHRHKVLPVLQAQPKDMGDDIDIAVFGADVESYFSGMSVRSVVVYSASRQFVLSLTPAGGGMASNAPAEMLTSAITSKQPAEGILEGDSFSALTQSVVPIVKDGNVELLLAITTDASAENMEFLQLLGISFGVALLMILALFLLSLFNTNRAEIIIGRQYQENSDLAAQANVAKEENQQKSMFLANITHELRTPLTAIIGFSEILRNEFVPAPGQTSHANYISDIHSAGTHLLSLINDILDFSKAEAGKLELDVTEVNASKSIQNCIRLIQPRAEISEVTVVEALPKEPMIIFTDGKKFKQILLNLLSNAVKFTPSGGKVTVTAWTDVKADSLVFEVRDSGIGIAPKDISRAMSPFGQIDNALSRKFEGTGLGLPLTKKFVEIMGGTFAIDSIVNKGTTITFSLPREMKEREGVVVNQVA